MAGEIQADYLTGRTLYAQVRSATATIWNTAGGAFEAYNTANIADYDIALTEQGTASGYYAGNMPAATGGVYNVIVKVRAGGAPAESDVTIAAGQIEWDGSAVEPLFGAGVNLLTWLGVAPAALAADGNVAVDVLAWQGGSPNGLSSGRVDVSVGAVAANAITAAAIAADAGTEIGTAVWASATRTLTAGTNIQLPANGLDLVLVDGKTLPRAIAIIGGICGGKISGAGTGTEVFLGFNGTDVAATVTVDANGNRTAVTY